MNKYIINVRELMVRLLPSPTRKLDCLDLDRAEKLSELGIVFDGYKVC